MFAFIFPAKEAALPYVGPAIASAVLGSAAFEREPLTERINFSRFGMLEQFAYYDLSRAAKFVDLEKTHIYQRKLRHLAHPKQRSGV